MERDRSMVGQCVGMRPRLLHCEVEEKDLHVQESSRDRNSRRAQMKYMRNKDATAVPTLAAVNMNKGLQS